MQMKLITILFAITMVVNVQAQIGPLDALAGAASKFNPEQLMNPDNSKKPNQSQNPKGNKSESPSATKPTQSPTSKPSEQNQKSKPKQQDQGSEQQQQMQQDGQEQEPPVTKEELFGRRFKRISKE